MKTKAIILSLSCLFLTSMAHAQVTIGSGDVPDNSALLDLKNQVDNTSNKGLLLPRVAIADTSVFGLTGDSRTAGITVYNPTAGVKNNGTGFYYWNGSVWKKLIASGDPADNLGNHLATQTLQMAGNNIDSIRTATVNNELKINDRNRATFPKSFSIYKNNGNLSISSTTVGDAVLIDDNTGTTTLTSAKISKGTDGVVPQAGYVATSQDNTGGVVWIAPKSAPGAIENVYEFLGNAEQTITVGSTAPIIPVATVTLSKTATLLITYSALPLPAVNNASVQGSIDLIVDGVKQISSYYSASDGQSLVRLGNYSTAQKVMVNMTPGDHTIALQAKSWSNSTLFNVNPYPTYQGSLDSDKDAMTSRLSVIVFNQ